VQLLLIRGFRLITKTLHRINILCYIRQPSRIIRARRPASSEEDCPLGSEAVAALTARGAGKSPKFDLAELAELRERAIQACDESRYLISRYQQILAWFAARKATERP
jgi:hypothetical protein